MICGGFLALWECVFFFRSWDLWRARWYLFSYYFLTNYWIGPITSLADSRPPGDLTYGETPFWTARKILLWSGAKGRETLWELGCGRGSLVFLAAIHFGMRAVGVDVSPLFARIGELISGKLRLNRVTWKEGDFLKIDFNELPEPDFVYLASTTFSWPTMLALTEKLEALPPGVKVISLSAGLPSKAFRQIDEKEFWFSWGRATAHLQVRV